MNSKTAIKTAFAIGYSINLIKANFTSENSSGLSERNRYKSDLIFIILTEIKREVKHQFGYEITALQINNVDEHVYGIDDRLQNEFSGYLQVAYLLGGLIAASTVTYPNIEDETKFTIILHDFLSELEAYLPHSSLKEISASLNSSLINTRRSAKEKLLSIVFDNNAPESSSVICHIAEEALQI